MVGTLTVKAVVRDTLPPMRAVVNPAVLLALDLYAKCLQPVKCTRAKQSSEHDGLRGNDCADASCATAATSSVDIPQQQQQQQQGMPPSSIMLMVHPEKDVAEDTVLLSAAAFNYFARSTAATPGGGRA